MNINKIKQDRYTFLKRIYDAVNGRQGYILDGLEIGKMLDYDREYTKSIFNYLCEEGLIEPMGAGIRLAITHYGIKEIEQVLSEPEKSSEHFIPLNQYNITINEMHGGAIQQGTNNSTINYTTSDELLTALNNFTCDLKKFIANSNLSNDDVDELETDIQTLEVQQKSKKPKTEILKASLKSIKTIIENSISGAATSIITANSETIVKRAGQLIDLLKNQI